MARRHAAAGDARGGEGIPSLRPSRAHLITTTGALLALAGVSVYAGSGGGRFTPLGEVVAFSGLPVLLAGVVLRFGPLLPWAVGLTGTGYIVGRAGHETIDVFAAIVGGALLLAAELGSWSIEHDDRITEERTLVVRRAALIAGLVAASMLVGFVLIGAAAVSAQAGLLLTVVGTAAALASVTVILRLLRG